MKRTTLETIRNTLTAAGFTNEDVLAEIDKELSRGAEEKAIRDAAYESIHSLVVDNLTDTPVTCADLYAEIGEEVETRGLNRYKVQHALNNLWQDEIEKIPGKPNTYKRKA